MKQHRQADADETFLFQKWLAAIHTQASERKRIENDDGRRRGNENEYEKEEEEVSKQASKQAGRQARKKRQAILRPQCTLCAPSLRAPRTPVAHEKPIWRT